MVRWQDMAAARRIISSDRPRKGAGTSFFILLHASRVVWEFIGRKFVTKRRGFREVVCSSRCMKEFPAVFARVMRIYAEHMMDINWQSLSWCDWKIAGVLALKTEHSHGARFCPHKSNYTVYYSTWDAQEVSHNYPNQVVPSNITMLVDPFRWLLRYAVLHERRW